MCIPPNAVMEVMTCLLPQQMRVGYIYSYALNPAFLESVQVTSGRVAVLQFSLFWLCVSPKGLCIFRLAQHVFGFFITCSNQAN